MKKIFVMATGVVLLACGACGHHSRRAEIDARRQALVLKQDSALAQAQAELAVVDSTLECVKQEYTDMSAVVDQHRHQLQATAEELTRLTQLSMRRDSLQVQFDMLCAKIKYIHKKQEERGVKKD